MKQSQIILIVIGFLLVALMATNPSFEEHKEAIKKEIFKAIESDNNSNIAQQLGEKIGEAFGGAIIDNMVERQNYILFSLTTIKIVKQQDDVTNNTITLGIFGQIILLKKYDKESKEFVDNNGINETEVYATTDSAATTDITSSVDYATDKNGDIVDFIGRPIKVGNIEVAQKDYPQLLNWEDAKKVCVSIGNGWRLPDINELYILYNNKDKIGNFVQNGYWSSSETNWTGGAFYVNFGNGDESGNRQGEGEKINPTYVRIVRTN